MQIKTIVIIGGGAAGFFSAFSCKEHHPDSRVIILEKTGKVLQKVKVSGGGRCNVTHNARHVSQLVKHYPRGGNSLKKCFGQFSVEDTISWFEKRGVLLKTEADNRMFPTTDKSQTIVDCFEREADRLGIEVHKHATVKQIKPGPQEFILELNGSRLIADRVIIATGGGPKLEHFNWLAELGHSIVSPVPSLFTFNMPKEAITKLMGLSVGRVTVKVLGSKLYYEGPLLVTHWGMSGPVILKLSAWGARALNELNYRFTIQVNWTGALNEESLRELIIKSRSNKKKVSNYCPVELPSRLWYYLLDRVGVDPELRWIDLDKKTANRIVNVLTNDQYKVQGKTTFKEEFVTCGGVSVQDVDFKTMESRKIPGLYFAGEVLDIDGITGGFNFQAAWSTGFVAGKLLSN